MPMNFGRREIVFLFSLAVTFDEEKLYFRPAGEPKQTQPDFPVQKESGRLGVRLPVSF